MSGDRLYRCWCKATNREPGPPRHSASWVGAKRAWFEVYADRVECGAWTIPFADVRRAILYETRQWFIPVRVLAFSTATTNYQFGFNPWASPQKHIELEIEQQKMRLMYSPFSIVIRAGLVLYLGYLAWRHFVE